MSSTRGLLPCAFAECQVQWSTPGVREFLQAYALGIAQHGDDASERMQPTRRPSPAIMSPRRVIRRVGHTNPGANTSGSGGT
jgi:hypothetical protein